MKPVNIDETIIQELKKNTPKPWIEPVLCFNITENSHFKQFLPSSFLQSK